MYMTSRLRLWWLSIVPAIVAAITMASAQQAPPIPPHVLNAPLGQVIPVDPLITTGTLPNGLRYYIRANKLPQGRAELRLAVNAGSVLEDEDQRGLAHFVEHMAFNGSLHFPGLDIISFMQAIGMRFGAHVNANTSFDETVYQLQIPTDNPAVIDRALLIMEDWAHNVTFDSEEIDKERGVILEEWRQGLGADERIRDKQFPLLLKGSRYAERLPIGNPTIIQNVSHERLKQFYADWYRPGLMGVVVVGDVDTAAIEAQIKAHFGSIPAPRAPKPRPAFSVPDQPGTTYSVITDPEATGTRVTVMSKMPARVQNTVGAYRQQNMVERLFGTMLSERLDDITNKPNAPLIAAETDRSLLVRAEEATTLLAAVPAGGVETGLSTLFTEMERVARFGFTATELTRAKLNLQRGLERAVIEKDKSPSGPLADEFVRNFATGEPIPGIVYEFGLIQRFLPQITLADVNALAKEWVPDRNRLVVITAPERARASLPSETTLAGIIKAATGTALTAYVDTVSTQPLLTRQPTPGTIVKTTTREAIGITEWQLSNGARVVLKPTTFQADQIIFRAVSPGGTSLASERDIVPAETADRVIPDSGLGNLRMSDLNKMLAGATVSMRADIGDTEEGVRGGSSRKDLERMFQLLYLTFTAPRADPVAFRVLTDQWKTALANRAGLPDTAFEEALTLALGQNSPRAQPMTAARVDQMNLEKSLAFYKERFADASDFVFVFVGSFDLPTMKPFVERYLASLPALHRQEKAKDVGPHPPAGIVRRQVTRGIEPKSEVSIVFSGTFQNDEAHRVAIRAMAETLSGNLHGRLREDLGGTYGVSVEPNFTKLPVSEYRIAISFGCDPEKTDLLIKAAFDVIDLFKQRGPGREQVTDTHATLVRDFETNSERNEYLLNRLVFKYEYGEDVNEVFDMRPFYDQLTPALLRDAARQYLDTNRYVQVTLVPERR